MSRINWRLFVALIGLAIGLTVSSIWAGMLLQADYHLVDSQAERTAQQQGPGSPNAPALARLYGGEKANQADCGTPRECRAEQREKDDLIAQQVTAEMTYRQARAADWQTGIAFVGIVLLIATLLYTSRSTRAAFRTIETMREVEQGQLVPSLTEDMAKSDGVTTTFTLNLINVGRTTAFLREVVFCKSATPRHATFTDEKRVHMNYVIVAGDIMPVETFILPTNLALYPIVAGHFFYTTIFSKKRIQGYFCMRLGARNEETGSVECVAARRES